MSPRGTLKIVTQRWNKIERLIHFFLGEVFGRSVDYHNQITAYWHKHGIFFYQPFRDSLTATIALLPYRHPAVHSGIYQMKYRNKTSYLPIFGSMLSDVLIDLLAELEFTHDFTNPLLVVVPTTQKNIRRRGIHLTHELARLALKQGLNQWVEYHTGVISQKRHKEKQSRLRTRKQRLLNPQGAYHVKRPLLVHNRNIIILDDVYTTGATMQEITRVVRKAGARRIIRITLAH